MARLIFFIWIFGFWFCFCYFGRRIRLFCFARFSSSSLIYNLKLFRFFCCRSFSLRIFCEFRNVVLRNGIVKHYIETKCLTAIKIFQKKFKKSHHFLAHQPTIISVRLMNWCGLHVYIIIFTLILIVHLVKLHQTVWSSSDINFLYLNK